MARNKQDLRYKKIKHKIHQNLIKFGFYKKYRLNFRVKKFCELSEISSTAFYQHHKDLSEAFNDLEITIISKFNNLFKLQLPQKDLIERMLIHFANNKSYFKKAINQSDFRIIIKIFQKSGLIHSLNSNCSYLECYHLIGDIISSIAYWSIKLDFNTDNIPEITAELNRHISKIQQHCEKH